MYQKNCFVELYLQIFQRLLRMFDKILSFFQVIFKLIFGMKNLFMEKNPLDYHFFGILSKISIYFALIYSLQDNLV